jgi:putative transposase
MKKSHFTDSQIIDVLKRAEAGLTVPELCRELGINSATFYKWRAKFGGMDASLMARMKEREEENRRLRKMYVEEKLKAEVVSEALAKCMVRLAFARLFLSDEGSLHKCIRPLASGLRLQPGHDEIRTHRSQ